MGSSTMALHTLMEYTEIEVTAKIRRLPASTGSLKRQTTEVAELDNGVF